MFGFDWVTEQKEKYFKMIFLNKIWLNCFKIYIFWLFNIKLFFFFFKYIIFYAYSNYYYFFSIYVKNKEFLKWNFYLFNK